MASTVGLYAKRSSPSSASWPYGTAGCGTGFWPGLKVAGAAVCPGRKTGGGAVSGSGLDGAPPEVGEPAPPKIKSLR
eukprot:scaffold46117_cov57-Attheya_sp.AAC.2